MKINDALNSTNLPGRTGTAPRPATANSSEVNSASANVQLSTQYQWLGAPGSDVSFDAAKVAEIKAALANGNFQIDPEKIASSLLDTVKDLLSTQ